jgi:tRNA A37 methylthiotransferase MiaB
MRTLSSLQESIADAAAAAFVGRTLDVLVEECDEDVTVGRSYREAPDTDGEVRLVTADGRPADLPIGRRLPARVAASDGVDLVATVGP